jgi:hypothetical protein
MRVSLRHYYMGRDVTHAADLTPEIAENAIELLRVIDIALEFAEYDGVLPALDEVTGNYVCSGWRPPAVNDRTANAAKGTSTHLTGEGIDLQDHDDRRLARWCVKNRDLLERLGLYMEDPRWTGGDSPWVHLQLRPPASRKRFFIPSATQAANDPTFYERYGLGLAA